MKAPTSKIRFSEAEKLLDYGFNNYTYKQFANEGDVLKKVFVQKGVEQEINAVFEENCGALINKGQDFAIKSLFYRYNLMLPRKIRKVNIKKTTV